MALEQLTLGIVAHPYVTTLVVLGFVGVVALSVRSLVKDDPVDAIEKRYVKGRLD